MDRTGYERSEYCNDFDVKLLLSRICQFQQPHCALSSRIADEC